MITVVNVFLHVAVIVGDLHLLVRQGVLVLHMRLVLVHVGRCVLFRAVFNIASTFLDVVRIIDVVFFGQVTGIFAVAGNLELDEGLGRLGIVALKRLRGEASRVLFAVSERHAHI